MQLVFHVAVAHKSATVLIALLAGLIGACGQPASQQGRRSERLNVLLILADDLGWSDLGHAGSGFYETPRLDRLVAEGMRFTSAYSNGPNCAPTRAALLSGQYAPRTGVYTVGDSVRGEEQRRRAIPPPNRTSLDGTVVTLAETLADAGYRTGHIGKWHLGSAEEQLLPRHQGFETDTAGNELGVPPSYFAPFHLPGLDDAESGSYLTDRLTDEALDFIEADDGRPFFLMLSHYAVHMPLKAKPQSIAHFKNKPPAGGHANPTYAAMVASLDESVGRLLDKLETLGLEEQTLVVFTSDNGGVGGYREAGILGSPEPTDNGPLRGGKGMLSEGGIRVPLIVRWPHVVAAGGSCDTPTMSIDIYPTLLTACAAAPPRDHLLDGADLTPILRGLQDELPRDALYWHFPAYLESGESHWRTTPVSVIRSGRHKLIEFLEDGRLELHDLIADPGEQHDIAGEQPELVRALHEQLRAWRTRTAAAMPIRVQDA